MATVQWATPDTIATALSTELNALANGSLCTASGAINNETGLYLYMSLELVLASLTPTAGAYLLCHLVGSLDNGSNYEDASTANWPAVVATFAPSTSASAKRLVIKNIPIPPLQFKLALQNQAGVALGATLNTLRYRRHNQQVA